MNSPEPRRAGADARLHACLAAIAEGNEALRAFVTVDALGARAAIARGADGPVVAIKDNIATAGLRTTSGSAFFAHHVPDADAEVVRRVRDERAIIVGKASLHEFAFGGTNDNPHHGTCRNPWNCDRIPGGSSGGSAAAVAAGMCEAALGTDTGGSVRVPAALNGLVGLRPTPGRVSNRGVTPVSRRFDTVGPMAFDAKQVAALYRMIAGHDAHDPASIDRPVDPPIPLPPGLRIGMPAVFLDGAEPSVARAVGAGAAVFAGLGARLEPLVVEDADLVHDAMAAVVRRDAAAVHADRLQRDRGCFGADVRARLELGLSTTEEDYAAGLTAGARWARQVERLFHDVDLILTPTVGFVAPPIVATAGMIERTHDLTRMTFVWSFSGTPAISIPCGFDPAGLPIGLQLVAAPWGEELLLAAAAAFQSITDHHLRRPPALPGRTIA